MKLITVSDHASARIKERMKIAESVLVEILHKRDCVLATTVSKGTPEQYFTVWDEIANKPFLVIVEIFIDVRNIKTVYETYPYHKRKDGVVITPGHIEGARSRIKRSEDRLRDEGGLKEVQIKSDVDFILEIRLTIYQQKEGARQTKRIKLATIPKSRYDSEFGSLHKYLCWFTEQNNTEIEIPRNSNVYLNLKKRTAQKYLIL